MLHKNEVLVGDGIKLLLNQVMIREYVQKIQCKIVKVSNLATHRLTEKLLLMNMYT